MMEISNEYHRGFSNGARYCIYNEMRYDTEDTLKMAKRKKAQIEAHETRSDEDEGWLAALNDWISDRSISFSLLRHESK